MVSFGIPTFFFSFIYVNISLVVDLASTQRITLNLDIYTIRYLEMKQVNFTIKTRKSGDDCMAIRSIYACRSVQVEHSQLDEISVIARGISGSDDDVVLTLDHPDREKGSDVCNEIIIENMAGKTTERFAAKPRTPEPRHQGIKKPHPSDFQESLIAAATNPNYSEEKLVSMGFDAHLIVEARTGGWRKGERVMSKDGKREGIINGYAFRVGFGFFYLVKEDRSAEQENQEWLVQDCQ